MKQFLQQFDYIRSRVIVKYIASLILFFTIIGSIALFFHLLLGHEQEIIENWFHESSWYHLIMVKILALALTFYFEPLPNKKVIESWFSMEGLRFSSLSGLLACLSIFIFILSPSKRDMHYYQWGEIFVTYLGNCLLFASDLFVMKMALKKHEAKIIHLMSFGLFFYLMNSILQGQILSFRCFYLYGFLIGFYFLSRAPYGFMTGLVCQIFFLVPLIIIFGQDAVWHDALSPFKASEVLRFEHFIIVLFLSLYYFEWKIGRLSAQRSRHAE